ncbi:hypothetical protein E2C01_064006 [Portunus trituberculatus]|uniref:Uncharacterized protein n=1 Tax=Portunus trituberculatus TaxID=210409 RepID=A0A5B7HJP9_PORTR|nr:hypothetical protein [Portunus trituberculatus]
MERRRTIKQSSQVWRNYYFARHSEGCTVFSWTINKRFSVCSLPPHSSTLPRATSFLSLCTCGAAAAAAGAAGGSQSVIGSAGGSDRAAAAGRPEVMADRKKVPRKDLRAYTRIAAEGRDSQSTGIKKWAVSRHVLQRGQCPAARYSLVITFGRWACLRASLLKEAIKARDRGRSVPGRGDGTRRPATPRGGQTPGGGFNNYSHLSTKAHTAGVQERAGRVALRCAVHHGQEKKRK